MNYKKISTNITNLYVGVIIGFFSAKYFSEKIIGLSKTNIKSTQNKSDKYKKIKDIDLKKKITFYDYSNVIIYKYLYSNDLSEKFLLDKIIEKYIKCSIISDNMKYEKINYNQLSVSANISKDKLIHDKLIVYDNIGIIGMILFDYYQKIIDYKINKQEYISKNFEAACFSNSLKFLSQYKLNKNLDEIIKWLVDGNNINDIIANNYANLYSNLLNKFIFFNIFVKLNYNLRLVKINDLIINDKFDKNFNYNLDISLNSKYNLINLIDDKNGYGHMISLINDIDKIIIYDSNLGVYELKDISEIKKFIITLIKSYKVYNKISVYEFV